MTANEQHDHRLRKQAAFISVLVGLHATLNLARNANQWTINSMIGDPPFVSDGDERDTVELQLGKYS